MLLVDGLRVTIKGFIILRGVSLVVPTGELIALAGRNGAGKTTTLKSIMGLNPHARLGQPPGVRGSTLSVYLRDHARRRGPGQAPGLGPERWTAKDGGAGAGGDEWD